VYGIAIGRLGSAFVVVATDKDGDVAQWTLDPVAGDTGTLVDDMVPSGRLVADVEGLTIWSAKGGDGYLVASVQGASRYNVYERRAPNRFLGTFRIIGRADRRVDGVTETDGIDVVAAALSPRFPRGLLVVRDDENTMPAASQNFKYVSWAEVEEALGLPALPLRQ
jgi:3-phytase